ncbi:MAG: GNAT family N-acetyltransferase [Alphaproteobacteria bacterium]|nr:GNAT family N-acetyltransferase [Alphaproteobacteria bacterium]
MAPVATTFGLQQTGRPVAEQIMLATPRLTLRLMSGADVTRLYEVNQRLNARSLTAPPLDREAIEELRAVFEGEWHLFGLGYLMICQGGRPVGHVRLKLIPDCVSGRAAELSFAIVPAEQGHGYASEAVAAVLRFAFETAGLDYVVACVEPDNHASVVVVERNGLVPVATGRHHGRLMRRYLLPSLMWRAQQRAIGNA